MSADITFYTERCDSLIHRIEGIFYTVISWAHSGGETWHNKPICTSFPLPACQHISTK